MRIHVGLTAAACVALAVTLQLAHPAAQGRAGGASGAPPPPPPTPREAAPIDLTGYWVSVVNEDYRWRMVTPPKGDYASVPLSDEGRKIADTWDMSKDGQCEAYGAAALMRMPTRLHITWESNSVLAIETDAGRQTRRLLFDRAARPPAGRTLQGWSQATWERPAPGASLKVVTTQLRPGWLRRNGVPYSQETVVTEYIDRFKAPNGDEWAVFTTLVNDPRYLNQEFVTSSHFKKEPDGTKWNPFPCKTT